jgi:hypothetical protein
MTHSGHSQEYFNLNSNSRVFTTEEFVKNKSGLLKIVENFTTESVYSMILTGFFPRTYLQYIALV